MARRTLLSWSSGKDSAWTLQVLKGRSDVDVVGLFCTYNEVFDRVAMHGVRIELVRQQAGRPGVALGVSGCAGNSVEQSAIGVGLPLELIAIPDPCSDGQYAAIMEGFVERARTQRIDAFAFGDLLLEDIRAYREDRLAGTGIEPLFPLWGVSTAELSREMVDGGLRAIITCVDPAHLPAEFAGQVYDHAFLDRLPPGVDPCGENGEFHTFVYDGPMFGRPVPVAVGETVSRDGFVFTDLAPG